MGPLLAKDDVRVADDRINFVITNHPELYRKAPFGLLVFKYQFVMKSQWLFVSI